MNPGETVANKEQVRSTKKIMNPKDSVVNKEYI
jgi:hypothetical protein